MTDNATELEAASARVDEILARTDSGHSHITVRRSDARALLLAATLTLPNVEFEVGMLREKLGEALAGGKSHRSDCAVHNAPAFEPTACDCAAAA